MAKAETVLLSVSGLVAVGSVVVLVLGLRTATADPPAQGSPHISRQAVPQSTSSPTREIRDPQAGEVSDDGLTALCARPSLAIWTHSSNSRSWPSHGLPCWRT